MMNTLSWMLYLAGIVDGIGSVFSHTSFFTFVGGAVLCVMYFIAHSEISAPAAMRSKVMFLPLVLSFPLGLISAIIPTERTIYMIAASEFGETVVTDPKSKKLLNDLYRMIERGLADTSGQEM